MRRIILIMAVMLLVLFTATTVFADDNITVKVNGARIQFDAQPRIENDRTIVPIRAIAEALGFYVDWKAETQTASISKGDTTIVVTVDSNIARVNGKEVTLDMPAVIREDRTMIPLRFVSEALGCTVDWFGKNKIVAINGQITVPLEPTKVRNDAGQLTGAVPKEGIGPQTLTERLIQSEEYNVEIPTGSHRVLRPKDQEIKARIEECLESSVLGVPYRDMDIAIYVEEPTEYTRANIKELLKVFFPREYETVYMYMVVTYRREAFEAFGIDSFLPYIKAYKDGRNVTAVSYTPDSIQLNIGYPREKESIAGQMEKTILTWDKQDSTIKGYIERWNITEYTKEDYDRIRKPEFEKELFQYYYFIDEEHRQLWEKVAE